MAPRKLSTLQTLYQAWVTASDRLDLATQEENSRLRIYQAADPDPDDAPDKYLADQAARDAWWAASKECEKSARAVLKARKTYLHFLQWMRNNKLVDKDGEPIVFYHGGPASIKTFRPSNMGAFDAGIYFTPDHFEAETYARRHPNGKVLLWLHSRCG